MNDSKEKREIKVCPYGGLFFISKMLMTFSALHRCMVNINLYVKNKTQMKILKTLSILFLSVLIVSCSSKDDDDDGGSAPPSEFNATISGGSFGGNYTSTLGSYYTDSSVGITIAITDANEHVIRFFLNDKGGFESGVTKIIGEIDNNGYYTSVVIRDQTEQISYNSSEGNVKISENRGNPATENGRLISGSFNITAISNSATTITMTGNFKNIAY